MEPKYTSIGGVPISTGPTVIVKDGTVSSREESRIKESEADANRRRSHQDAQRMLSSMQLGPNNVARLGNRQLVTQDSPCLVLFYRKLQQHCISELTMVNRPLNEGGGLEMMFTLVCPKCLARGVPQGQAQLQVRNSHRQFDVDTSKSKVRRIETGTEVLLKHQHGTVTVKDKVRCSNTGCGWTCRIIDSVVDEA